MNTQLKQGKKTFMGAMTRYGLIVVLLLFAAGQVVGSEAPDDSGARRVTLGDGSKTKVIAYSKATNKLYLDLENETPEDEDIKYYMLKDNVWMPTTAWSKGDIVWDENEVLPLNGKTIDGKLIMDYGKRDSLSNHMPLDVALFVERKVKVNPERTKELEELYTKAFLRFQVIDSLMDSPFQLAVDITLFDEIFGIQDSVAIDTAMVAQKLLLPVIDTTITSDSTFDLPLDHLIQVIHSDYVPTFIHTAKVEIKTEIEESAVTTIVTDDKHCKNLIWWIVGAVVFILAIVFGLLWKRIDRFFKNRKPSRKFGFDFDQIADSDKVEEILNTLKEKASKVSESDFVLMQDHKFFFVVRSGNASQFVVPSNSERGTDAGFYPTLVSSIDDFLKKSPADKKLKRAKSTIAEIDKYVAVLGKRQTGRGTDEGQAIDTEDETPKGGQTKTTEELEIELEGYKNAFKELVAVLRQEGEKDKLTVNTVVRKLKGNISSLKNEVSTLKSQNDSITRTNSSHKDQIEDLEKSIQRMKDDPESFENENGYGKLAKLIKASRKADSIKKEMEQNPDSIGQDTPTGILISKGRVLDDCLEQPERILSIKVNDRKLTDQVTKSKLAAQVKKSLFLDNAKDNVRLIANDQTGEASWLKGSELMAYLGFVTQPETILQSKKTDAELYKLMNDLKNVINSDADQNKSITMGALSSDVVRKSLGSVLNGYNNYRIVKETALQYGTEQFVTNLLEKEVKIVFDDAERYLKFKTYKDYWQNVISPLYEVLDKMYKNDIKDTTRALMFYSSQLYSIACIMNEIHGGRGYTTSIPKLNVSVFNVPKAPPISQYGFPLLDENIMLEKCKFQYRGRDAEGDRVNFLKEYAPMPFIFITSYYDNNLLSKAN